jgi:two-component system, cell cycle sensor histidine kinase and response regulator CckA
MWVYDLRSLAFLAVNEAASEQYGYSRDEFLRMTIRDVRPAEDVSRLLESVSHGGAGLEQSGTWKHRRKDGTLLDVQITSHNLDWAGRPARLVSAVDITERKRAEEELRQSEESYRRLVEQSPDAILVHRHGTILFANSASAAFFGAASADELLGRQHLDFVHPDHRGPVKKRIQEFSYDLVSVRRNETKFLRLDGKELYAEVAARSVIYQGEAAIQVMFRDISQRVEAEEKLRRSEANLAAAQAIAHVGNWSWDVIDDVISWSAEMFRIYGVSPEEFDSKPASVAKLVHPDDQWVRDKYVTDMLAGKRVDSLEYRILRPDGSERVVQVLGGAVDRDAASMPVRISGVVLDVTEHKKAEERFYKAFHTSPEPITIATVSDGRYIDVNQSFLRITGYEREEVIGRTSLELKFWQRPEDCARFVEMLNSQGSVRDLEITFCTKSGEQRTALDSAELIEVAGQKCILAIFRDTTEQRSLEKQLRQAQKMEAIGQLSGGIAHDFNNLLSVIIGYSEVLEERLPQGDPLHRNCEQIKKAGQSAASLTRQLLAFSRQQVLEPRVLDLNAVILNVEKMLRRLIGEHIDLKTALSPALERVKADQGQIEQVIVNLAVNARDAMPSGGKLTIETANIDLDQDYVRRHPPHLPGPYVLLAISDTGIGMDAETQAHIFEPFFTTKEMGKGTGLGLATVYGVVKQSGGFIWVYSEPGHGTTFKIYLPQTAEAMHADMPVSSPRSLRGTETVLLVEDGEALREFTATVLTQSGYTVLAAERPDKAIDIARQHRGPIHLLLTDVIMPGMNGRALAGNLVAMRPEIKVVYMSGYTGFTHPGLLDSDVILLQKPFTREALLQKLREGLITESNAK